MNDDIKNKALNCIGKICDVCEEFPFGNYYSKSFKTKSYKEALQVKRAINLVNCEFKGRIEKRVYLGEEFIKIDGRRIKCSIYGYSVHADREF
jgi:hypothetical protein